MDEVPFKGVWIVGGVTVGLAIIAGLGAWAWPYISAILPG